MGRELAFKLPNDNNKLSATLVQCVPEAWNSCSGQLVVPLASEVGGTAAGAGFLIDGSIQFGKLEVVTPLDSESKENPTDTDLIARRRIRVAKLLSGSYLPSFIEFRDTGASAHVTGLLPMVSVVTIASDYLRRGYAGDLTFRASSLYDDHTDTSQVEIHTTSWRESIPRRDVPRKEKHIDGQVYFDTPRREHGPIIKILDETNNERLDFLLSLCRDAKLEEVDPNDFDFGYSHARINL